MADLKPIEKRIYEIVTAAGGEWVSRDDVKTALGRPNQIHPGDIAALEKLTWMGLIEQRPGARGAAGTKWLYRIPSSDGVAKELSEANDLS